MQKEWLIKNFIGAGDVVVLSGAFDAGKTNVALGWAMAVASGTPWRGQPVNQGGVVYLGRPAEGEEKEIASAAFFYAAATEIGLDQLPVSVVRSDEIDLLRPPGEYKKSIKSNPLHDLLDWHRKRYGSLRLVVIDTVADYFQDSLLKPEVIDDVLATANAISSLYRCAVVLSFECELIDGPVKMALARLACNADAHYKINNGVLRRLKPYNRNKGKMFTANFQAEAEHNQAWREAKGMSKLLFRILACQRRPMDKEDMEAVDELTRILYSGASGAR